MYAKVHTQNKKGHVMTQEKGKSKHISVRVPNKTHSELQVFAKAHDMTITKTVVYLLSAGLKAENQEPVATKTDIDRLLDKQEVTQALILTAIKEQPIVVQQIEEPKKKRKFFSYY